ncbi:MAG: hypothetical protein J2P32_05010, partial [Actinobacteria bacterium]|nr:hypothetical protein [Actinomycetota bacterium]
MSEAVLGDTQRQGGGLLATAWRVLSWTVGLAAGALLVWIIAATVAPSTASAAKGESTAAVELVGFFGQDSNDAEDDSGLTAPRWTGGIGHAQPTASGVLPASSSHQNGRQATPRSDSSDEVLSKAAVLARVTAADAGDRANSPRTTSAVKAEPAGGQRSGSLADLLTGLFDRLARAWGGGSGDGVVAPLSVPEQPSGRASEAARDIVNTMLAQPRTDAGSTGQAAGSTGSTGS